MYRHAMQEAASGARPQEGRSGSLKRRLIALGLVGIVIGGGLVAAITATSNTFYGMFGETNNIDTSVFTLTSSGQSVASIGVAAAGATNTFAGAIELVAGNAGAANTALVLGQWIYQVTLAEAGANTFAQSATAYYKIELFLDGTSKGALYVKNAVGDAVNAEGSVVKWDLGASLPTSGAYVVKVTRMAA